MILTCQRCHSKFEYQRISNKGKLPSYCGVCKQVCIAEAKKNYILNAKDKKKAKSYIKKWNKEIAKPIQNYNATQTNENRVYRRDDILSDTIPYLEELKALATDITTISMRAKELAERASREQSNKDKYDTTFLHMLETLQSFDEHQAFDLLKEAAESRTKRRDWKTFGSLLHQITSGLPNNALQIVMEGIKKSNDLREELTREI